ANADIERGVDLNLLAQERELQKRLQQNEKRRVELYGAPDGPTIEQAEAIERERKQLLAQSQEIKDRIRAASPRYAALQYPEPLNLEAIQQQILDGETMLLQYSLGKERSYLWAITQDELQSYALPNRAAIEAAAKSLLKQIDRRDPTSIQQAADELARILLEPVMERLQQNGKIARLAIVGDEVLQYVPFAALPQPGQGQPEQPDDLLVSRYEIVSLPSSSTLATLREFDTPTPAPKALAIFADPVFDTTDERVRPAPQAANANSPATPQDLRSRRAQVDLDRVAQNQERYGRDVRGWSRLPGTRKEAEAITQLVNAGDRLQKYGFDVNYQTVTAPEVLGQYRLIHFATHGILDSADPKLSGLVLSLVDDRGRPQNGYLRLHEIYNLKLSADLVVLSACQTGLGKNIRGEGVVGMTRGFMYAGAPRVLVSLWSVDDAATAALMTEFYQNLLQNNLPPAAALQAAQASLRQDPRWSSPFYWAAFTLQGEWRW
ncbi:MAG: CHAT domain-containing protein, partial [Cyanobacteria bacterium J06641_5]